MTFDALVLAFADHPQGAAVGDAVPVDPVGELGEVLELPLAVLGRGQGQRRGQAEGAGAVQEPFELPRGGRGAFEAGWP